MRFTILFEKTRNTTTITFFRTFVDADASSSEQMGSKFRRGGGDTANKSNQGSTTGGGCNDVSGCSAVDRLWFDETSAGKSPLTAGGSTSRNRSGSISTNRSAVVKTEPSGSGGSMEMLASSDCTATDTADTTNHRRIGDAAAAAGSGGLLQPIKVEGGSNHVS